MDIVDQEERGINILALSGSLDAPASQDLQARIGELISEGVKFLVLDLEKTDLFAGAAIRVLLMLHKKLEAAGGGVILCSVNENLMKDLELAGLKKELEITAKRDDAVARLAEQKEIADLADIADKLLAIGEKREIKRLQKQLSG